MHIIAKIRKEVKVKVGFVSLGCSKNLIDTEATIGKFKENNFNIVNDEKFALDLLRDKKILIVQGSGFNWHQPDHFRVVYLPRIEVLKK